MKFRIHFTHNDGTTDSVEISGDTIEDIEAHAHEALDSRGIADPARRALAWSEEL